MEKTQPLVSILIPVYNRESIIEETVQSAISQSYDNIEIIIVDNCSTDNTWNLLRNFSHTDNRIKIFQNTTNVGPVLNWLKCIENANGTYFKILWSDDKISPNFVAEALNMFDSETAFVLSPVEIFDDKSGEVLREVNYDHEHIFSKECFLYNHLIFNKRGFMVSPGCGLFRANDLRQALIIDIPNSDNLEFKRYGAGNDLLIFMLIALKYSSIKVASGTRSYFRSHKDSISVEKQDEINLYYEWSKSYFIKEHYAELANVYKSRLFLKKQFSKHLSNLYHASKGSPTFSGVVGAAFRKIMYKE